MNRKKVIWLIAVLLIMALALCLWGPVIFQRGNPIPYLVAAARLFSNGSDSLCVTAEVCWRYFTVWQVPARARLIA